MAHWTRRRCTLMWLSKSKEQSHEEEDTDNLKSSCSMTTCILKLKQKKSVPE